MGQEVLFDQVPPIILVHPQVLECPSYPLIPASLVIPVAPLVQSFQQDLQCQALPLLLFHLVGLLCLLDLLGPFYLVDHLVQAPLEVPMVRDYQPLRHLPFLLVLHQLPELQLLHVVRGLHDNQWGPCFL